MMKEIVIAAAAAVVVVVVVAALGVHYIHTLDVYLLSVTCTYDGDNSIRHTYSYTHRETLRKSILINKKPQIIFI